MPHTDTFSISGLLLSLLLSLALTAEAQTLPSVEAEFRARYFATPIAIEGVVINEAGSRVAGAALRINGQQTRSDAQGRFFLPGLDRRNAALVVTADGYRDAMSYLRLLRPLTAKIVAVNPIVLTRASPTSTRFLFGGDVSFGRRFLDPDASTPPDRLPPDDPDALIIPSNPLPGTRAVVQYVQPYFQRADFGVVNLETPVTDSPASPHPEKDFVFFTLPGSLPALIEMGVDYVSLGNNHVYDYLDPGVTDTLAALAAAGIANSGAGPDSARAFQPYRTRVAGTRYSLLSMTSVSGGQFQISYVADENKGGAADLRRDDAVTAAIVDEIAAGYFPIVQLHTGREYTYEPSAYAAARMQLALDGGAALVIGHHPHVAQGFDYAAGRLVAYSLGNFIFDQARLETMLGVLLQVDINNGAIERPQAIPVYLEDFRPRPVAGALADILARRLGETSSAATTVLAYNGKAQIYATDQDLSIRRRKATLTRTLPASGWAVIDLRHSAAGSEAALATVVSDSAGTLQAGRDLMTRHGDFEDYDIDDEAAEIARWDVSAASRFACLHQPYRGAVAVCSTRSANNSSDSVTAFRNRIRVLGDALDQPNKNLTLFGYARGDSAGPVRIVTRYYASSGDTVFGEQTAFSHPGGSYAWTPFATDLTMPADTAGQADQPRALRLFLRHSPPPKSDGLASVDELAVISWEPPRPLSANTPVRLATPNSYEFIRLQGEPGKTYRLELTLQRHLATVAHRAMSILDDSFETDNVE